MRFHDDLQCFVQKISYDYERRVGSVAMADGSCTDMKGCIDLFKKIDPEVIGIETIAGGRKDTSYHLIDGEWEARIGNEQRPKTQT